MSTAVSECDLIGNRVFAEVIKDQDEIILDLGWDLNPMTGILIKIGEDTDTHTEAKAM